MPKDSVDRRSLTDDLDIIVSPSDAEGTFDVAAENKSDKLILELGTTFNCQNIQPSPLPGTKVLPAEGEGTLPPYEVALPPKSTKTFATLNVIKKDLGYSYKYSCSIQPKHADEPEGKPSSVELPPGAPAPPADTKETSRHELSDGLAAFVHQTRNGYVIHVHNPNEATYWTMLDFSGTQNLKLEPIGTAKRDEPEKEPNAISLQVAPGATEPAATLARDPPTANSMALSYTCSTNRMDDASASTASDKPAGTIKTQDQSLVEGDGLVSHLHTIRGNSDTGGKSSFLLQLRNNTGQTTYTLSLDFNQSENIKVVPLSDNAVLSPDDPFKLTITVPPKELVQASSLVPKDPSQGSCKMSYSASISFT